MREARDQSRRPAAGEPRRTMSFMVDQSFVERARQLAVPERLELIGELWDSIEDDSTQASPEVAGLIGERLAAADANPMAGRPWSEVKADLLKSAR